MIPRETGVPPHDRLPPQRDPARYEAGSSWGSSRANGNASAVAGASRLRGDNFEAYDRLPPLVREALQVANQDWCPKTVTNLFRPIAALVPDQDEAARLYVEAFREAEEGELLKHSDLYRIRYRTPSPHVAAQATLLRTTHRHRPAPRRRR